MVDNKLQILQGLATSNLNSDLFDNFSEYLRWFLRQSVKLFDEETNFRFINFQYFNVEPTDNEYFFNGRLLNIPTLVNLNELTAHSLSDMLREIAAFLMATAVIHKNHSEPNKVTINTFRDRFKIEIIRVDKDKNVNELFSFNKSEGLLIIYIHDLYDKKNSESLLGKNFFNKKDLNIQNNQSSQFIIEGSLLDNKLNHFATSQDFPKFIQKVNEFLSCDYISNLIKEYTDALSNSEVIEENKIPIGQIKLFITTLVLHSWLKSNLYDYHLMVCLYWNKRPVAFANLILNLNTKIDMQTLKHLHLAQNIAFSNFTQFFNLLNKPVSKHSKEKLIFSDSKEFIYASETMKDIDYQITKLSKANESVLLLGETGVGKDLIASELHKRSSRKNKPFITVPLNCLPEQMIESELFGSVKGSYTGSVEDRKGKFVEADGGTLYFPEISDIPIPIQLKLLEFFQYKTINVIGGRKLKVDVKIIFASNRDLDFLMSKGKIRDDFYYRINVLSIKIPPLRVRKDDIIPLAEYFISKHSKRILGYELSIDSDSLKLIKNFEWLGNARQLENFLIRAIVLTEKDIVDFELISKLIGEEKGKTNIDNNHKLRYKESEKEFRKLYFQSLIEETNGCISEIARISGLSKQGVYKILTELNLEH